MNTNWKRGERLRLSPHFTSDEFECHCGKCEFQQISGILIERLETLRERFGCPIRVTSGYRCAEHQANLRRQGVETAAGKSQHELGNAADISALDIPRLSSLAQIDFKSVGTAASFVHVDTRDDKPRRWAYGRAR